MGKTNLSKDAKKYLKNFFIGYPPCSLKDLDKNTIKPFVENIENEPYPGAYILDREIVDAYNSLHNKKASKPMKVNLCKGCIKDLKEYNPYIVPIKVVKVSQAKCDNTRIGKNLEPSYAKKIKTQKCSKKNCDKPALLFNPLCKKHWEKSCEDFPKGL